MRYVESDAASSMSRAQGNMGLRKSVYLKLRTFSPFLFTGDRLGSGAFGDVYLAEAIGILCFHPREKILMRQKPLLGRKRSGIESTSARLPRSRSTRSGRSHRRAVTKVAVKKLKGIRPRNFDNFK